MKKRVLLVDDDKLILDEMRLSNNWEALGYTIAATAFNGKRAFEYFLKYKPELVITDIVMPIMGGLEFIELIRQSGIDTCILIITAFDEFEYAKKALQSGVVDYILKTELTTPAFYDKLRDLCHKIDVKQQYNKRLLCSELHDFFMSDNNNISGTYELAGQIQSEPFYFFILSEKRHLQLNYLTHKDISNELLEQHFYSLEALKHKCEIIAFTYANHLEIALLRADSLTPETIKSCARVLAADNKNATVYYCFRKKTVLELNRILYVFRKLFDFNSFFPPAEIIDIETLNSPMHVSEKAKFSFPPLSEDPNMEDKIFVLFSDYISALYKHNDLYGIYNFYLEFCYRYGAILIEANIESEPVNAANLEKLIHWFVDCYRQCALTVKEHTFSQYSPCIRQAVGCIMDKYYDPNFNIEDISKTVNMSSSYLSNLFKKETGQTINNYLTGVRIDTAKYMLLNSNDKIYTIAERVGYTTAQYFSQVFFKKTGLNPLDYRRTLS